MILEDATLRAQELGFRPLASISLESYLPSNRQLRPTICISDAHLLPEERFFADDAPEELFQVLVHYSDYQLFFLGDLIESLPLLDDEAQSLTMSNRLREIIEILRNRNDFTLVPGNHDVRVINVLRRVFTPQRLREGGFSIDRVAFFHGHEPGLDLSGAIAPIRNFAIPLGVTLKRLGLRLRVGAASNQLIASTASNTDLFLIFGHTHKAELRRNYANLGHFLRHGMKTYATIEKNIFSLWGKGYE
jgi:predicted phosphodiesterase